MQRTSRTKRGAAAICLISAAIDVQSTRGLSAQTPGTSKRLDGGTDIVVRAKPADWKRRLAETRAIATVHDGQLSRFEAPICPQAIGFSGSQGEQVEQRIRVVADAAGIRVDKLVCRPNLVIVAAIDGATFVARLNHSRPMLFQSMSIRDLTKLLKSPGPSWTWQAIRPERRDGGPVEMISQLQIGNSPPQAVGKNAYIVSNAQLSRLTMPIRQDTNLAFVVLDARKITGLAVRQVADYAAMVGLASIKLANTNLLTRPSILTMFADISGGRSAQLEATAFDRAYLAALYSGESGYSSDQKSSAMAIQIGHSLDP